jgi:hypothetical protein
MNHLTTTDAPLVAVVRCKNGNYSRNAGSLRRLMRNVVRPAHEERRRNRAHAPGRADRRFCDLHACGCCMSADSFTKVLGNGGDHDHFCADCTERRARRA